MALNTFVFGLIAVLVASLVNQRLGSYFGGVIWSRVNAFFIPAFIQVKGKEHIRPEISYVVVSNHMSYFDIFMIYGWLGIDIKWVMKKELARIPGLGFGSKKVGHIFIDRSNSRVAMESLNEAKKKLTGGTSVVIFPEGTRSKTGEMGHFKRGAFKLALDLNLHILPVTLNGTGNIWPTDSMDIFPGRSELIVHKPIDIRKYDEGMIHELMEHAAEVVRSGRREI
jgi:1-acyl-sn-glycerol-3-phosphate acyltransferase